MGEATEKDWNNLEWDSTMDKLTALEESFDSTDLGALEVSINRLATEDLQVPEQVINEARQALACLVEQHEKILNAIRDGDIEIVRDAIKLAKDHLLPEALISKAKTTLEIADALDKALRNQDQKLLASLLSKAEAEGATALVHRTRSIEHLQAALRSNDVDAIEKAMSSLGDHGGPPALLEQAAQALEALAQDKSQMRRQEEKRQKREQLMSAIRDGTKEELQEAIEDLEGDSFMEEHLQEAREKLELATNFEEALKSQDQAL